MDIYKKAQVTIGVSKIAVMYEKSSCKAFKELDLLPFEFGLEPSPEIDWFAMI